MVEYEERETNVTFRVRCDEVSRCAPDIFCLIPVRLASEFRREIFIKFFVVLSFADVFQSE